MTELKPCPFCGAEAVIVNLRPRPNSHYSRKRPYVVKCSKCRCAMQYVYFETEEEAAKVWNRRV